MEHETRYEPTPNEENLPTANPVAELPTETTEPIANISGNYEVVQANPEIVSLSMERDEIPSSNVDGEDYCTWCCCCCWCKRRCRRNQRRRRDNDNYRDDDPCLCADDGWTWYFLWSSPISNNNHSGIDCGSTNCCNESLNIGDCHCCDNCDLSCDCGDCDCDCD